MSCSFASVAAGVAVLEEPAAVERRVAAVLALDLLLGGQRALPTRLTAAGFPRAKSGDCRTRVSDFAITIPHCLPDYVFG